MTLSGIVSFLKSSIVNPVCYEFVLVSSSSLESLAAGFSRSSLVAGAIWMPYFSGPWGTLDFFFFLL
jgi:hypothetical protein